MPFTLWRNDMLLGTIVIPFRGSPSEGIGGIFKPEPAFDDIRRIVQSVNELHHDRPVWEVVPVKSTGEPGVALLIGTITGAIVGVGATRRLSAVRWAALVLTAAPIT